MNESQLQWVDLLDTAMSAFFYAWFFSMVGRRYSVRGTQAWWRLTDVYFETKPFVMPSMAMTLFRDIMHNASRWTVLFDVFFICLYWYLFFKDNEEDPRDRWGKRRRALKRLVTPRRAPVPAPVSA